MQIQAASCILYTPSRIYGNNGLAQDERAAECADLWMRGCCKRGVDLCVRGCCKRGVDPWVRGCCKRGADLCVRGVSTCGVVRGVPTCV